MITSKLSGAMLDYYVAKCEGLKRIHHPSTMPIDQCFVGPYVYSPTYYREQADPIIEREHIAIVCGQARMPGGEWIEGKNELEAAMRAWVIHNFGDNVS